MKITRKRIVAAILSLMIALSLFVPTIATAVYPTDPFYVNIAASKTQVVAGESFDVTITFKNTPVLQ